MGMVWYGMVLSGEVLVVGVLHLFGFVVKYCKVNARSHLSLLLVSEKACMKVHLHCVHTSIDVDRRTQAPQTRKYFDGDPLALSSHTPNSLRPPSLLSRVTPRCS
jgi:hypothetical protein